MRKLIVVLSFLMVASMLLSACGAPATQAPAPATAAPATAAPATPAPATAKPATPAPAQPAFKSKDPTTFTEATFGEPEGLDPALTYETAGGSIEQNVYETLIFYKADQSSQFIPQLATDMPTVSADGKTYTFKIRTGVKFHNGDVMTPDDVAYSFVRGILQGGGNSPQWMLTEPFFGIGTHDITEVLDPSGALVDDAASLQKLDAAKLKAPCTQLTGQIVADDTANTVTMTLAQPYAPFLAIIANSWGSVMDKKWVVAGGGWDGSCDTWQKYYGVTWDNDPFATKMNGTGPFMLDHWTKGQEIVLTANPNYWRTTPAWDGGPTGVAKIQRVVIQNINEWGTRFSELQAGDADVAAVPVENRSQPDAMVGQIAVYNSTSLSYDAPKDVCGYDATKSGLDKFTICPAGQAGTGPLLLHYGAPTITRTDVFFNFNIANLGNSNPYIGSGKLDGKGIPTDFFADPHVRKAFNYCFNWDTYDNDIFKGEAVQSYTIPLPGMAGADPNAAHYSFDADKCTAEFKASTLKAADGKSLWDTGFRVQIGYNQGNTTRQTVAEILAANLSAVNPKFVVETVGLPWASFLKARSDKVLPIFVLGWLEDYNDPHDWYQPYLIGDFGSYLRLPKDLKATFTDLINKGVAETDPAKRDTIYKGLNQAIYDNPPFIILSIGTTHGYVQRWVNGLILNPIYSDIYYYPISKN